MSTTLKSRSVEKILSTQKRNTTSRELSGTVTRIMYQNPEGFIIAGLFCAESGLTETVLGNADVEKFSPGVEIRLLGRWKLDDSRGWRFHFESFTHAEPLSRSSVVAYLSAHCPYIGPARASKLWNAYGEKTTAILRDDPQQVADDGVLEIAVAQQASVVLKTLGDDSETRIKVFGLIGGRGFPRKLVDQVIKKWGVHAPAIIEKDPFCLLVGRFPGVGFRLVDSLYQEMGLPKDRLKRQMFAAWDGIRRQSSGDTWLPLWIAEGAIRAAVGTALAKPQEAIELGLRTQWLAQRIDDKGKTWLTTPTRAGAEETVAVSLRRLCDNSVGNLWPKGEIPGLSPHQQEVIGPLLKSPVCILGGTPGTGKAQPLSAKVLTRSGWKTMGEIKVGDFVANSTGGFSKVTGVYPQGLKEIVKVSFSDGASAECCREHLWFTQSRQSRKNAMKKGRPLFRAGRVHTTEEIQNTLHTSDGSINHYVPMVRPIQFDSQTKPMDPYLMGLLLGDGCFRGGYVTFTKPDKELIESIKALVPEGCSVRVICEAEGVLAFVSGHLSGKSNPMTELMRSMGLMGLKSVDKFVPDVFKFNDVESRLAILQGLLDTDGNVENGTSHIEYSTSSRQLADDVQFIVQSLGGTCKVTARIPVYAYAGESREGAQSYRLFVKLPSEMAPFRCSQKRSRFCGATKYLVSRRITNVEQVGQRLAQCISVDAPDNLYVTDHCILTHNTYTSAVLLKEIVRLYGFEGISVCAPTGKAAVRITEAINGYGIPIQATTIHRFLGIGKSDTEDFAFLHGVGNPVDCKFLVIDEWSMGDTDLAASLLLALSPGTHVLFVGDPYQLPPVGHGAVLRDMIASKQIPFGLLEEIRRNSGLIVEACRDIRLGKRFRVAPQFVMPEQNLRLVDTDSPEEQIEVLSKAIESVVTKLEVDPVWDVQVLCALNNRSKVSRIEVNKVLQNILNPIREHLPTEKTNPNYRVGDKVICLRNHNIKPFEATVENSDDVDDYVPPASKYADGEGNESSEADVFVANGDMGRVLAVSPKEVVIRFDQPLRITKVSVSQKESNQEDPESTEKDVGSGGLKDFTLAYAITAHKSQGSEWKRVFILIDDAAGMVASREHHYTAISRGKDRVCVIGNRKTMDRQLMKVALADRKTFLKERIQKLFEAADRKEDSSKNPA